MEMNSSAIESVAAAPDALGDVLRTYLEVTERLQSTHESLEREVSRLRRELESKDRELERRQRLAAIGEMAAGMAHEVRNPLGAIALYSELLRRRCADQPQDLKIIDRIETGVRAIEGVVQDTLALAPRRGAFEPRSLLEVVNAAAQLCEARLADRAVRVDVRFEDREVRAPAEPRALERVFMNLIANAADASPQGGDVEVAVAAAVNREVTIEVRDRGCGLAPDVLEQMFNPFFTTKDEGTGLGLTMAHRLVEAHGGRLSARNRQGGGAAFTVVLPVVEESTTLPAAASVA